MEKLAASLGVTSLSKSQVSVMAAELDEQHDLDVRVHRLRLPDLVDVHRAGQGQRQPRPTTQPHNTYRFNAMRWDSGTGQYDMGFRNYDPGVNQFLSRDMYDGALANMNLTAGPFTGSPYAFGQGNPISNIELDGHMP